MKRLSPRDQMIIMAVAIVVLAALFVMFLIVPRFRALSELDGQLREADSQISAARALLAQRQDAKSDAAETQARLLRIANQVPDAPEMPALIIALQDASNEAGLEFTKIAPSDPEVKSTYTSVPVSIVVKGSWDDLIEFLRRVTNMTREVRLVSVSILPADAGKAAGVDQTEEKKGELTASVGLQAYVMGTGGTGIPGAPGAPTTGAPAPSGTTAPTSNQ